MSINIALYDDQPLDPEKHQIRLIKLCPGSQDAPIICSSSVVSLDDKPEYMALSYVWGSPVDPNYISFNGFVDIPVTRNLHTALSHLRDEKNEVTLWADALSINQSDFQEKGHQISLMGDIYRHSTHTCIFLGAASKNSDLAMQIIGEVDIDDPDSPKNNPDQAGLEALVELLKRPWWTRVWVVQEALLPTNVTVRCGNKVLPIDAFVRFDHVRRGLMRKPAPKHQTQNAIQRFTAALGNPFKTLLGDWGIYRKSIGSVSLAEWVYALDDFDATDPRDKIFGLLGLAKDLDRQYLGHLPGKDVPTSHVYTHCAMWFILSQRSLTCLHLDVDSRAACPVGEEGVVMTSWVADLSSRPPISDPTWSRPLYITLGGMGFRPGGEMLSQRLPIHIYEKEADIFPFLPAPALRVRGLVVDKITYVNGNPYVTRYESTSLEARTNYSIKLMQKTAEKIKEWEAEAYKPREENPYGGTKEATREAFERTMAMNRDTPTTTGVMDGPMAYSDEWREQFEVFMGRREFRGGNVSAEELLDYLFLLRKAVVARPAGRNFVITSKGYFGLVPLKARVGDEICVLEGSSVVLVLRRVAEGDIPTEWQQPGAKKGFFTLVGESYVHGVSDGEWIAEQSEDDVIDVVLV